ncbi:hypothetical protein [Aliihoeflea sp. PC F10.4]
MRITSCRTIVLRCLTLGDMQPDSTFFVIASQNSPTPRITLGRMACDETLTLDAARLAAQYALPWGDILLVLDDDCPFEEELHLVLVRKGAILDRLGIGFPYTPAIFEEMGHDGCELRFTFESDKLWMLHVEESGTRSLSWLPAGTRKRGRWLKPRHLHLSRSDPK